MSAPPKDKPAAAAARADRADRTSAVVTASLVGLALLGTGTVFWEPLTAFALGAPTDAVGDGRAEPRAPSPAGAVPATNDAGATVPSLTTDASGNS